MFRVLQNPTRRGIQMYIISNEPDFLYKGPYSLSRAQEIKEKIKMIKMLSENIYSHYLNIDTIFPDAEIVEMKGPSGAFLENENDEYILEKGFFIKIPNLGKPDFTLFISKTKMGINKMIKNFVENVNLENESHILQLIIQGMIRKSLNIGDSALRNFIVKNDIVYQIDVDNEASSPELFPKMSKKNLEIIKKVSFSNRKILLEIKEILSESNDNEDEVREETYFDELKYIEMPEKFVLEEYPKEFIKCRKNSCIVFIVAFLALFKYGFYSSKKVHSITWVRTSIYTGLLEDMSLNFLHYEMENIIDIIEDLEKFALTHGNCRESEQKAYIAALTIYQKMSSGLKTRELSFWLIVNKYPKQILKERNFYNDVSRKILKMDLSNTKNIQNKHLKKICKAVKKMEARCVLADYFLRKKENELIVSELKHPNIPNISFSDIFIGNEEIVPVTGYRQEKTGIFSKDGTPLNVYLCKSILQKAFRVGLPLETKYFKKMLKEEVEMSNKISLNIPSHYFDKHVKSTKQNMENDDLTFLNSGMRSSFASDIEVNGQNLYQIAMKPYYKMVELGVKATSKNL